MGADVGADGGGVFTDAARKYERIQPIEGILRTETLISLEEVLNRSVELS